MTTSAPSCWLPVVPDAIPRELTDATSWYPAIIRPKAGKVGVWDKIPGDPSTGQPAKWRNPATRCTFGEAFMAYESGRFAGLGYMMDADAGVIALDLDHCIAENDAIAPWAQEIVEAFHGAYWERSISGTGLRGFCRGTLAVGGCRSKVEGCSVELYADVRFVVVTGQAVEYVEVLPELQGAVDALHARLTAGRVRATGTAIGTGLTGRLDTVSAEALAILEAVMGGRHSARMAEIWSRDDLQVAGASEDDWALASEIAYQTIRRGHTGAALAQLVEETMRAGPYRAKWDQRRGATTWLAQDVANAIATVQKRLGDHPALRAQSGGLSGPDWLDEWPDGTDNPPLSETPAQIIARLEGELAAERTIRATQQVVIRAERAENEAMRATLDGIQDLLAVDSKRLSARDKLVAIPVIEALELARIHGQPEVHIPYSGIAARSGMSESTVGLAMKVLCTDRKKPDVNPDAPFWKVTRYVERMVDGAMFPTSETVISLKAEEPALATVLAYQPTQDRKHGGQRVKGCPEHPTADLIIRTTTTCAECGEQVGPARETLWQQVDGVGHGPSSGVSGGYSGQQVAAIGGHDGEEMAELAAHTLPIPFAEARVRRLYEQDARVATWRCSCRCGCRALERYPTHPEPGEPWRCEGCGHGPPAAVAGGSE